MNAFAFVACFLLNSSLLVAQTPTPFEYVNPTDEEQYFLELVNRARANPAAEAARYGIGLNQGLSGNPITTAPKPPLVFHPALLEAAREHSHWMLVNDIFSHVGSGGRNFDVRIEDAGYPGNSYMGENLGWAWFSGALNHKALIDKVHEGIIKSPLHRQALMDTVYDEVGVAPKVGSFRQGGTTYNNAMVATQSFGGGSGITPAPYITGVVYYDFNGNNAYDMGEGVGGAEITLDEDATYISTSASSGGYAIPVSSNGTYTLQAAFPDVPPLTFPVVVSCGKNSKQDVRLAYQAPIISGDDEAVVGEPKVFPYTPVPRATKYIGRRSTTTNAIPTDGAEAGMRRMTRSVSGYNPIVKHFKKNGKRSFRLAHRRPVDQHLTVNRSFIPRSNAYLRFHTRLTYASKGQYAQVQVSNDGGRSWRVHWQKRGNNKRGEKKFRNRAVYLGAYAGQEIRVRFTYHFRKGKYYKQKKKGFGWYFDNVRFEGIAEITGHLQNLEIPAGGDFEVTFPQTGNYALTLTPVVEFPGPVEQTLPAGKPKQVWVTDDPPLPPVEP